MQITLKNEEIALNISIKKQQSYYDRIKLVNQELFYFYIIPCSQNEDEPFAKAFSGGFKYPW
jgi:hypothetical protein